MDEIEPQWLREYREQVLEARESEREDDFRLMDAENEPYDPETQAFGRLHRRGEKRDG